MTRGQELKLLCLGNATLSPVQIKEILSYLLEEPLTYVYYSIEGGFTTCHTLIMRPSDAARIPGLKKAYTVANLPLAKEKE